MSVRNVLVVAVLVSCPYLALAQGEPGGAMTPAVQDLGNDRYKVGNILIDKARAQFTVPGSVLRADPPLEYIAVTVGGQKGYESLLELAASGVEFNLACILIGLTNNDVPLPRYQFDPEPVRGMEVTITATWQSDDGPITVPVENLLTLDGEPAPKSRWHYLGSFQQDGPYGGYAADLLGTLIGFVHDPASVIEHDAGLGMGNYGAVGGNMALLPPPGSAISLVIAVRGVQ
jgi:hypothetical protein